MFRTRTVTVRLNEALHEQVHRIADRMGCRTLEKYILEAVRRDINTYMVEHADPLLPESVLPCDGRDDDEADDDENNATCGLSIRPFTADGAKKLVAGYDPEDDDSVLTREGFRPVLVKR